MAQYYGAPPSAYYNPAQFLGPDPLREAIPAIRNLGDDLKEQSKYEDSQAAYANQQMVSQQEFAKELAEEKDKNKKAYEVAVASRKARIRKAEAEQRDRENKLAFDKEKNEQDKAKLKREQDREDEAMKFIQGLDTELEYPERLKAVAQAGFADIGRVKEQFTNEYKVWKTLQDNKAKNWRTGQIVKGRAGKGKSKIETTAQYNSLAKEYANSLNLTGELAEKHQKSFPYDGTFGKSGEVASGDMKEVSRMRAQLIEFVKNNPGKVASGEIQVPSSIKREVLLGNQNLPAPQATTIAPNQLSTADRKAYKWAMDHPNDPRSATILKGLRK